MPDGSYSYFIWRHEAVEDAKRQSRERGRYYMDYGALGWFTCPSVPVLKTKECRCFYNGGPEEF